jgi:hypothetical protein
MNAAPAVLLIDRVHSTPSQAGIGVKYGDDAESRFPYVQRSAILEIFCDHGGTNGRDAVARGMHRKIQSRRNLCRGGALVFVRRSDKNEGSADDLRD